MPLPDTLGLHVASLTVYDHGGDVCVDVVVVANGLAQNLGCVASALLGPANALVTRGETKLVVLDLPGGSVHSPAITADLTAGFHYDEGHLFRAADLAGGLLQVWLPFAPGDESWLLASGGEAGVFARVTLYQDGAYVTTVPIVVPYLGQALAATARNAGTL